METSLLILAAGLGSRFGGIKQLEAVGGHGETILEYSLHDAIRAGFNDIVFLIRRDIEDRFRLRVIARLPRETPLRLAYQELSSFLDDKALDAAGLREGRPRVDGRPPRSKPWGTGHALLCASKVIDRPFAVINADDWYGHEALKGVRSFLAGLGSGDRRHCMAGYRLDRTTREGSPVSRGLCLMDAEGFLRSVEEHPRIVLRDGNFLSLSAEGGERRLAPETLVSMNLWGFGPSIFDFASELFGQFLDLYGSTEDEEFYLPGLVNSLLEKGAGSVKVLAGGESWMGLTHAADLDVVRSRIAELEARGLYPSPLWRSGLPEATL